MSAVLAGGQHVRRTRSLIAQGNEEYLLASIQRSGTGRVEQDGRTALLSPGDIAFYDSTRPYTLHFDHPFHQLVVQVPKRELMLRDTRPLTARALRRGTPGGAVSAFFTSLFDATRAGGEQPAVLLPHVIGLLCSAASFAGGAEPAPAAAAALARERVLEFLRRHLADPSLDADAVAACAAPDGPGRTDRAQYVDEAGYQTIITVAYWDDQDRHQRWSGPARAAWLGDQHAAGQAGFFTETVRPSMTRFETLFSNDRREGIARLAGSLSGEVAEHAYWGGARDRLPLAQTDPLKPGEPPEVGTDGVRRVVGGQQNLCLIRSGQDWTDTDGDERRMYLEEVEPVLRAGMDFLRDEGRTIGCYANRYLRVDDEHGNPVDKSFGMSWWRSLADLDRWAKDHPTHKAIFGQAMKYLSTMGPAARLRLYHEVTIAAADEQAFEYLNCHPDTGMLRVQEA
jgi:aldoxime dehydratase